MEQAVAATGLSHSAAKQQILRLKLVVRVSHKQDFFLVLSPEEIPMGAPAAVKWLDDYFRWLKHPYYLALLSAAAVHDSQPQAVQVVQVMTDNKRRAIEIGRLKIQFFLKTSGIEKVPVVQPAGYPAVLRVSSPEATALDLLRYSDRVGGYSRSEETILPMAKLFKVGNLRCALDTEDEPALGQRLGFLLESAGHEMLAGIVHRWLPRYVQWTLLAPGSNLKSRQKIKKWKLIKNV
jgi:predicted transcriptional regulator of viral defense system